MTTTDTTHDLAEGLMTASEVCTRLKICRTTLTHLPNLRPVHIGRAVRYRNEEVRSYMDNLARERDGRCGPGRPRTGDST